MNETERITYLDGLRGILAILVVIAHLSGSITGYGEERYLPNVNIAVDAFFVLSGFVLSRLYLVNSTYGFKKILISRFFRLFPLYILTTFLVFLIYKINNISGGYFPGNNVIEFKTLLVNISMFNYMGFDYIPVLNDPAWSVIVEFWISAFLMYFLIRLPFYGVLITSIIFYFIVFSVGHGFGAKNEEILGIPFGMLRGIAGISFGIALYQIRKKLENSTKYRFPDIIVTLSFIYFIYFLTFKTKNYTDISVLFVFFVFFLSDNLNNIIIKILNHSYFQYLGKISFSIYLIHTPIILLISPYIFYKEINSQPVTILFFVIIIIIMGDIVNKYFEQPCNKLFKKN